MNVSVLGTGTMGSAMAANLARAGLSTVVWDRTPSAAAALASVGVTVAPTLVDAVRSADVVITMVSDGNAVASVATDQGMLDSLPAGAVWVQMATIGVDATDRMAALTAERRPDVAFVDAPVSGSKGPAERGELIVLASGPADVVDRLEPVFDAIGRRTIWAGGAGRGSRLKLVLNSWLAFLAEGLAETVALADGLGITRDELRQAVAGGPLAAPYAMAKLAKIADDDFAPEFPLVLALKDVDLALAATPSRLPGMAAISEQWHRAVGDGLGDLDISAASLALQRGAAATVGG
ncbi:MAG: 3-hydroxyisobutyrate dehydrogenase [Actinomycetota bacterium]|jgi:3-hydroxyisobutyrate dehydrogenase|nr:3-hydroxyisobutyrate dehydrogenase [Actinomycetota bacterium]